VLHRIAQGDVLAHFLTFSVAIRILVSDVLSAKSEYCSFAHELLPYFVSKSASIYGNEVLVYNVHSLVHLFICVRK
jgi:hypothetical protein